MFPVELFLALVETESASLSTNVCEEAWHRIDPGMDTPAGVWRAAMASKYEAMFRNDLPVRQKPSWDEMRADLLHAFGCEEKLSLESKLGYLRSLTKDPSEAHSTFLVRVQWVLDSVLGSAARTGEGVWTLFLFLLGLPEADQRKALDALKGLNNVQTEDIRTLIQILDDATGKTNLPLPASFFEGSKGFPLTVHTGVSEPLELKSEIVDEDQAEEEWYVGDIKAEDYLQSFYDQDDYEDEKPVIKLKSKPKKKRLKREAEGTVKPKSKLSLAEGKVRTNDPMHLKARATKTLRKRFRVHRCSPDEDPKTVKTMSSTIVASSSNGSSSSYYCGFCRGQFKNQTLVNAHHKSEHGRLRYQCDICPDYKARKLEFVATHKLRKHGVLTETFVKYECDVEGCDFFTLFDTIIAQHNKRMHSKEVTETTCTICGARFPTPTSHRSHVESVHMKMKPFSCDQCGKSFSKKGGLKIHMEAAHGALPSLMCNICGAALKNEQTLKDHIFRRHKDHQAANIPDEKRNEIWKCEECEQVFDHKANLAKHMRKHRTETHIPCPMCPQRFIAPPYLRNHVLSNHLKVTIKPFTCVLCAKTYSRSKDAWEHVGLKHEGAEVANGSKFDWKSLSRAKPDLVTKRDCLREENNALKGVIDDKYLRVER